MSLSCQFVSILIRYSGSGVLQVEHFDSELAKSGERTWSKRCMPRQESVLRLHRLGWSSVFAVVDVSVGDEKEDSLQLLCQSLRSSRKTGRDFDEEGCLSIPGVDREGQEACRDQRSRPWVSMASRSRSMLTVCLRERSVTR